MTSTELKRRTHTLAVHLVGFTAKLPAGRATDVIARQLLRAGTSVAANYRAACRARSRRDFVAKLGIVEEEADETAFWLEVLIDAGIADHEQLDRFLKEANEITAMMVSSIKTARARSLGGAKASIRNPQSTIRNHR